MSLPIEALLHFEHFLKTIELVKGGVPDGILPKSMFKTTDKTIGDQGLYYKVTTTRKVAQQVAYGSASKNVIGKGVTKTPVTLIHAFEHFMHSPNLLALLKSLKGGEQKRGAEIVGRKIKNFTQRFINLRRAAAYSALFTGYIYLDSEGALLPSSVGAAITIDFGVPAAHRTTCDWDGNGAIIGASWATAGTDIIGDVHELKKAAIATTGYPIKKAFYGSNIPGYIASNTALLNYMSRNNKANAAMVAGTIPNDLLGLEWIDAQNAFYEDEGGTNRYFCPADQVVFTPDPKDSGWWGMIEGSYNVPTDVGRISSDAMAALNSIREVFGMFGFAQVSNDPVGLKQFGGDTFIPVVSVPKAIFIADTTP